MRSPQGHSPTAPCALCHPARQPGQGTRGREAVAGLLAGLLSGEVAQLLPKRAPLSPELVWELRLNQRRLAVPAWRLDGSFSASSPVTETAGGGSGSALSWEGEMVPSRATQHLLFKRLQLFYEAIVGFNAASAGLVTAAADSSSL